MTLAESFEQLRKALAPLGIELGREALHLWRDQERAGREPLPAAALRDLVQWAEKQLADRT